MLFSKTPSKFHLKPDLDIVVTIATHTCDQVLKRVLKLSTCQLQIFLVNYEDLQSLQLCEDQSISGKFQECRIYNILHSGWDIVATSMHALPLPRVKIIQRNGE